MSAPCLADSRATQLSPCATPSRRLRARENNRVLSSPIKSIMSSVYSSRRISFSDPLPSESVPHTFAKSVPETPARAYQRPVFRTVPDSPKENPLLLDDHGLDLSILTHKLQLYQLELEEAELRHKHKKTAQDKHAAEVAAAARFRDELEKREHPPSLTNMEGKEPRSRAASIRRSQTTAPRSRSSSLYSADATGSRSRSTSLRKSEDDSSLNSLPPAPPPASSKPSRTRRPEPLMLPKGSVTPQEVRSAALPTPQTRESTINMAEMKKHWRRTTISSGRHSSHKIILLSSNGKSEYCDFDVPPVPQLSASASTAASPPSMSPMTPLYTEPTEDQIRRELETFALEEGPNIQMSRRSSVASRKRIPVAFVPDPEDILPREPIPPPPEIPSAFVDIPDTTVPYALESSTLGRKKSFFSRFERKNDVDSLLDLYMTDEQLSEVKAQKKKDVRSKRQTFFKRWQSTDMLFHKAERPG